MCLLGLRVDSIYKLGTLSECPKRYGAKEQCLAYGSPCFANSCSANEARRLAIQTSFILCDKFEDTQYEFRCKRRNGRLGRVSHCRSLYSARVRGAG